MTFMTDELKRDLDRYADVVFGQDVSGEVDWEAFPVLDVFSLSVDDAVDAQNLDQCDHLGWRLLVGDDAREVTAVIVGKLPDGTAVFDGVETGPRVIEIWDILQDPNRAPAGQDARLFVFPERYLDAVWFHSDQPDSPNGDHVDGFVLLGHLRQDLAASDMLSTSEFTAVLRETAKEPPGLPLQP